MILTHSYEVVFLLFFSIVTKLVNCLPLQSYRYSEADNALRRVQAQVMENPKLLFGDIRVPSNHKVSDINGDDNYPISDETCLSLFN